MYRIVLNETSYYGAGCRSVIAEEVRKRGFRKALLVTDKDLIRFGVAEKIERVLADAGIPYEIYSEIKANPTIRNVQQGVEAFKRSGADFMVALGGGSSIDTAKAVGIIVNNPEFADVRSLEGTAATKHRAVPTFAVPTTAGTAAEVTINYVITDPKSEVLLATGGYLKSQGYDIRVLNLVNLEESDGYNPFRYIRDEKDALKLVNNLIQATTPKGSHESDPFWTSATRSLAVKRQRTNNKIPLFG